MNHIFSDKKYNTVWDLEYDSGNRESDETYLELKSQEQAWVVNTYSPDMECIDLGCGAGELLKFLSSKLDIVEALDFSENMLEKAKMNSYGRKIKFVHADPFLHLPGSRYPVWLTTGALNQYLDEKRMRALFEMFVSNTQAKAFYLFDCVDPIQVKTLTLGSDFLPISPSSLLKSTLNKILSLAIIVLFTARLSGKSKSIRFRNPRFGFGYIPSFWNDLAKSHGLSIRILSSANFEYRYHVVIRKI
jgi:SAM-dependent methyltransferase